MECEWNVDEKKEGKCEEKKRKKFKAISGVDPLVVKISRRFFRLDFFVRIGDFLNPSSGIYLRETWPLSTLSRLPFPRPKGKKDVT